MLNDLYPAYFDGLGNKRGYNTGVSEDSEKSASEIGDLVLKGGNQADAYNGSQIQSVSNFINPTHSSVSELVSRLNLAEGLSQEEIAKLIYNYLAKNYSYEKDPESVAWKNVDTTISDGKGDCEDLVNLMTSMLIAAGVSTESIMVYVDRGDSSNPGHLDIGYKLSGGNIIKLDITNAVNTSTPLSSLSEAPALNPSEFDFAYNSQDVFSLDGQTTVHFGLFEAMNMYSVKETAVNKKATFSQEQKTNIINSINGYAKELESGVEQLAEYYKKQVTLTENNNSVVIQLTKNNVLEINRYSGGSLIETIKADSEGNIRTNIGNLKAETVSWLESITAIDAPIAAKAQDLKPQIEQDYKYYTAKLASLSGTGDQKNLKTMTFDSANISNTDKARNITKVRIALDKTGKLRLEKWAGTKYLEEYNVSAEGTLNLYADGFSRQGLSTDKTLWADSITKLKAEYANRKDGLAENVSPDLNYYASQLVDVDGLTDLNILKQVSLSGSQLLTEDVKKGVASALVKLNRDNSYEIIKKNSSGTVIETLKVSSTGTLSVARADIAEDGLALDAMQVWSQNLATVKTDAANKWLPLKDTALTELTDYTAILNKVGGETTLQYKSIATLQGDNLKPIDLARGITKVIVSLAYDGSVKVEKYSGTSLSGTYSATGTTINVQATNFTQSEQLSGTLGWTDNLSKIEADYTTRTEAAKTFCAKEFTYWADQLKVQPGIIAEGFSKVVTISGNDIPEADRANGVKAVVISLATNGDLNVTKSGDQNSSFTVSKTGNLNVQNPGFVNNLAQLTDQPWTANLSSVNTSYAETITVAKSAAKIDFDYYSYKLASITGTRPTGSKKVVELSGTQLSDNDRQNGIQKVIVSLTDSGSLRLSKESVSGISSLEVDSNGVAKLNTPQVIQSGVTMSEISWASALKDISAENVEVTKRLGQEGAETLEYYFKQLEAVNGNLANSTSATSNQNKATTCKKWAVITGEQLSAQDRANGVTSVRIELHNDNSVLIKKESSGTMGIENWTAAPDGTLTVSRKGLQRTGFPADNNNWQDHFKTIDEQISKYQTDQTDSYRKDMIYYGNKLTSVAWEDSNTKISRVGTKKYISLVGEDISAEDRAKGIVKVDVCLTVENVMGIQKVYGSGDMGIKYLANGAVAAQSGREVEVMNLNGKMYVSSASFNGELVIDPKFLEETLAPLSSMTSELTSTVISQSQEDFTYYTDLLQKSQGKSTFDIKKQASVNGDVLIETDKQKGIKSVSVILNSNNSIQIIKYGAKTTSSIVYVDGTLKVSGYAKNLKLQDTPWQESVAKIDSDIAAQEEIVNPQLAETAEFYAKALSNLSQSVINQTLKRQAVFTGDALSQADKDRGITQVSVSLGQDNKLKIQKTGNGLNDVLELTTDGFAKVDLSGTYSRADLALANKNWQSQIETIDTQNAEKISLAKQQAVKDAAYYGDKVADNMGVLSQQYKAQNSLTGTTVISTEDQARGIDRVDTRVNSNNSMSIYKYSKNILQETIIISAAGKLTIINSAISQSNLAINTSDLQQALGEVDTARSAQNTILKDRLTGDTEFYAGKLSELAGHQNKDYKKIIVLDETQLTQADYDKGYRYAEVSLSQYNTLQIRKYVAKGNYSGMETITIDSAGKTLINGPVAQNYSFTLSTDKLSENVAKVDAQRAEAGKLQTAASKADFEAYLTKLKTLGGNVSVVFQGQRELRAEMLTQLDQQNGVKKAVVTLGWDNALKIEKYKLNSSGYEVLFETQALTPGGLLSIYGLEAGIYNLQIERSSLQDNITAITKQVTDKQEAIIDWKQGDVEYYADQLAKAPSLFSANFQRQAVFTGDQLSATDYDLGIIQVTVTLQNDDTLKIEKLERNQYGSSQLSETILADNIKRLSISSPEFTRQNLAVSDATWSGSVNAIKSQIAVQTKAAKDQAASDIEYDLNQLLNTAGKTDLSYKKTITISGDQISASDRNLFIEQVTISLLQNNSIEVKKYSKDQYGNLVQTQLLSVSSDNKLNIQKSDFTKNSIALDTIPWTASLSNLNDSLAQKASEVSSWSADNFRFYSNQLAAAKIYMNASYKKYATLEGDAISTSDRAKGIDKVNVYLRYDNTMYLEKFSGSTRLEYLSLKLDATADIDTVDYKHSSLAMPDEQLQVGIDQIDSELIEREAVVVGGCEEDAIYYLDLMSKMPNVPYCNRNR